MCDKKNYVLFTDSECLVLSPNFKLSDESQILLKIPRKDNMYSFDIKNIVPKETLTCLVAKDTLDESMLWHRRLGHINFKNINKLVKENLVRGLPLKHFENDQTCVACLKGKQHKASSTEDETSEILKNIIKEIENLVDKKVKTIRCDNETEFKNKVMNYFCREKCIKREYSVARTPQQNEVAKRRNRTLIKAARTMLADSKLPTTFWAKAVSTTYYVQNRVLIVKPYNKTPYELFRGFKPALSFMKPFECHVTILNTLDSLGKFDGKSDGGFFVGYSLSSKAFMVYNTRTMKVEENLHVGFLENKPMIEGNGTKWLFDIDSLTKSMNYVPVTKGTSTNESADAQGDLNACTSTQKEETSRDGIVMPIWKDASYYDSYSKDSSHEEPQSSRDPGKKIDEGVYNASGVDNQERPESSTIEPTSIAKALSDSSWVEAMQEELLQFKLQQSAFLYGTIKEEVYVTTLPGNKISRPSIQSLIKVVKALYGALNKHQQHGLQVHQKEDGIFISQDKYVAKILKKFNYIDVKSASTPVDLEKPLVKDKDADDIDISSYPKDIPSLSSQENF
ncbi:putative ribonuclease H-like domain-containing protein [Tanacetum coccineum]